MFTFLAVGAIAHQMIQPVLWLNPNGDIQVNGSSFKPKVTEGVARVRLKNGYAYDFLGKRGGILFPDIDPFKLQKSMTVSVNLMLRSYVNDGPGAQILFRGDDRSGLDPYTLSILCDGTISFGVGSEDGYGMGVRGEIPLNRWTEVIANYDGNSGQLRMWINGELVSMATTSKKPFIKLDGGQAPGLGIGNVQNNLGPHNQPLNGLMADLRLYSQPLQPEDIRMVMTPWGSGGAQALSQNIVSH